MSQHASHPHPLSPCLREDLPFTPLDRAFARFVQEQQPSTDPRHTWLALLVSHQFGRGHARLDVNTLSTHAADVLAWPAEALQQLPPDVAEALDTLPWTQGDANNSPLVRQGQALYLRRAWQAEQHIRGALLARLTPEEASAHAPLQAQTQTQANPPLFDWAAGLNQLFPATASSPQPDWQKTACALAARGRLLLLTGGPGTGKTTTVARLLALLQHQAVAQGQPLRIHLAAPTGKAAARLNESLAGAVAKLPSAFAHSLQAHPPQEAQTLHRLLQWHPTGLNHQAPLLATDLVVVDEASMIDLEMMARLLACVPLNARLVLLGDKDQLASVEAGAVWAQLCEGADQGHYHPSTVQWLQTQAQVDVSPWAASQQPHQPWAQQTVMLRHSHRFDGQGGIGQWAQAINSGNVQQVKTLLHTLPTVSSNGAENPAVSQLPNGTTPRSAAWAQALHHGWADWLARLSAAGPEPDAPQARALIDAFGRFQILCAVREGPWGVQHINRQAAQALHLPSEGWYAGRPIMVTCNDAALGLMNGDVGLCLPHQGRLRVAFPVGPHGVRWVAASRLEAVETVFAMTVHKSQGSEFEQVLLVLPDRINPVLTRELLYTGLTRAKQRALWHLPNPDVLLAAVARRVWRSGGLGHNPAPYSLT